MPKIVSRLSSLTIVSLSIVGAIVLVAVFEASGDSRAADSHLCLAAISRSDESAVDPTTGDIAGTPADGQPESETEVVSGDRPSDPRVLRAGDRVRLSFFEQLESEEEARWSGPSLSRRPAVNFHQRVELNGIYDVQDSGLLIIPLLGAVPAADVTVAQFEAEAMRLFKKVFGRPGFVSAILLPKPIYVIGDVRTPGAYQYEGGLTVLHAVALAGGRAQRFPDPGQALRAVKEKAAEQRSVDELGRQLARRAVLQAELDGADSVSMPGELTDLVGSDAAQETLATEKRLRSLTVDQRLAKQRALDARLTSARGELARRQERLKPLQSVVELRKQRVEHFETLRREGQAMPQLRRDAEIDLNEAQARYQDALVAIRETEGRVAQIEADLAATTNDARHDLERALHETDEGIAKARAAVKESANALSIVRGSSDVSPIVYPDELEFWIVRNTSRGPEEIKVYPTFPLQPGDLVQVKTPPVG